MYLVRQRGTGIVVDDTEVALVVLNTHADVTFCTINRNNGNKWSSQIRGILETS